MPGIRVDGNDVLACYAVMAEAAARARRGEGPTLIEAVTYRLGPHTTSDDPTRYRSRGGGGRPGPHRDPIARYRTYLGQRGVWTDRGWSSASRPGRSGCAANCATRWSTPHDFDVGDVFDTVYADITPDLARAARAAVGRAGEGGVR